jgi:hypothetical protein
MLQLLVIRDRWDEREEKWEKSFKWNRRHFTNSFPSLSFPFPVSRELNKKTKKKVFETEFYFIFGGSGV